MTDDKICHVPRAQLINFSYELELIGRYAQLGNGGGAPKLGFFLHISNPNLKNK